MRLREEESEQGKQDSPRGFLLCLLQAGNGLGRRREPIFNMQTLVPEFKFRERPVELSSVASRGRLQGSCYYEDLAH